MRCSYYRPPSIAGSAKRRNSPDDPPRLTAIEPHARGAQSTPMEQAIREGIEKATACVAGSTPPAYFRHAGP